MLNKLIILSAIFITTGCAIPTTPNYMPAKIDQFSYDLIDDGSKEMKLCKMTCETKIDDCKNRAEMSYQSSMMGNNSAYGRSAAMSSKQTALNITCPSSANACFKDICGGKVVEHIN